MFFVSKYDIISTLLLSRPVNQTAMIIWRYLNTFQLIIIH